MGVKLLLRVQPQRSAPGPAHYDLLKRLVDDLCASQLSGRHEAWAVTCQLMKQGQGVVGSVGGPAAGSGGGGGLMRDVWAVTFRDAPELLYLLHRPEHKALECDVNMARLLEKKLEYGKQMSVRLEGHTYSKGDFLLRLCTATQAVHSSQAFLGHCLEVEYLPLTCMPTAEGVVAELVELLRAQLAAAGGGSALQLELVRPSYEKYGVSGLPYSRTHAAIAYGDLVVAMLNSSAAAAQQQQQGGGGK